MKRHTKQRITGLLAVCLTFTAAVYGREGNPAAYREGDRLCVRLPITAGIDLPANGQLTVTPVVSNGENQILLAPVVFTGRIREKVDERRERLYGIPAVSEGVFSNTVIRRSRKNPSANAVLFEGDIPYEPWMAGGRIVLYRDLEGCAGHRTALPPLVAAEIAPAVQPRLSFLVPADEPKRHSEQLTAVIHFPQGRSVLLRGFADNSSQLARIDSLTARLLGNDSLSVETVYLKGYASPEDTYPYNTRLSANRVRSIRNYLQENFGLDSAVFITATEPEDWDSLRRWVVLSDLPARNEVLAVIDTVSDPDARDAGIRQIDNGATYLRLLREVYPQLRRVDYRISYTGGMLSRRLTRKSLCLCNRAGVLPRRSVRLQQHGGTGPALRRHTNGPSMPEPLRRGSLHTEQPRHPVPDRRRFGEGALLLLARRGIRLRGGDIQPGAFRRIGLQMVKTTSHSKYCKKNKTMKKIYNLLLFTVLAAGLAACSSDEEKTDVAGPAAGNLQIIMRTPQAAAGRGPVYRTGDFRILAFKKTGTDYVYMQDIPLAGMNFDGTALTGTVQFPAGDYKFLPSYGLVTPGNYTWPDFTDATLSDALYVTHTGENFPAAFMLNTPLDAVPAYTVSLDGPKQTVSATLRRAVSRVDVLFIRAEKDAATGVYTEKPGADVFGPEKLAGVNLAYTGANSRLGLSGEKVSGLSDVSHTIGTPADVVTIGTGESTVVGADKYDFENVQPADIISGSAHLKGTYLIPNPDNTGTTGFSMQLTSGKGSARTIALRDKIPVERNKATLIRIYVLGENVFTTGVDFEVEVDTVWDGSNFVDGEID